MANKFFASLFSRGGGGYGAPSGSSPMGALGIPSAGNGSMPGTGPDGINAGQLHPNSREQNMLAGVPYQYLPVYPPFARLAADPGILYFTRFRYLLFDASALAASPLPTQQLLFSNPTIVLARTAAAYQTDDDDLPVGRSSLDCFTTQWFRSGATTDLIDAGAGLAATSLVLGSCVMGDARQPALIPGNGIFFDTGTYCNVSIATLIDHMVVHVCAWCLEEYGPARG